jgi:hypothetical protein
VVKKGLSKALFHLLQSSRVKEKRRCKAAAPFEDEVL